MRPSPTRAADELPRLCLVWTLARPHTGRLLVGSGCLLLLAVIGAAYAYLTGPLVQTLLTGGRDGASRWALWLPPLSLDNATPGRAVLFVSALLVALALLKGLLNVAQTWLLVGASEQMSKALRTRTFAHLLRLPLREHRRHAAGDLLARLVDDTRCAQQAVIEAPLALLREGFAALALLLVAVWLAPRLAMVSLVALPLIGWGVARISRRVRRAAERGQRALGGLATQAHRSLRTIREIKSAEAEPRELARFARLSAETARGAIQRALARSLSPLLNEVAAAAAIGATLYYGASLATSGQMPAERLLSFFAAVLMLYRPVKASGEALHRAAAGAVSVDRLAELLRLPQEEPPERPTLEPARGQNRQQCDGQNSIERVSALHPPLECSLELRGVCFAYRPMDLVLRDLSLRLAVGEIVALMGSSGAGKSTLVDIVCGLETFQQGQLLWDGQPLDPRLQRDGGCFALRRHVALVPQQPLIIDGDVAENLRLSAPAVGCDRIWLALHDVGLEQRVRRLPSALATRLGSGGVMLSAGEVQRLAIARALLKDAPVMVLDEPTAALDAANESLLVATIGRLRRARAVLLVTHSPRALAIADRVVSLESGTTEVVSLSTHRWRHVATG